MALCHINIGSNTGHRHALIEQAVALIALHTNSSPLRAPIIESEPWGFSSPHPFLNLAIAIELPGEVDEKRALALFALLQEIERKISSQPHRNPDGSYRDRAIDIDLIAIENLIVNTPTLTLPHPRMHLRPFVWQPLHSLQPSWTHPLSLPFSNM